MIKYVNSNPCPLVSVKFQATILGTNQSCYNCMRPFVLFKRPFNYPTWIPNEIVVAKPGVVSFQNVPSNSRSLFHGCNLQLASLLRLRHWIRPGLICEIACASLTVPENITVARPKWEDSSSWKPKLKQVNIEMEKQIWMQLIFDTLLASSSIVIYWQR